MQDTFSLIRKGSKNKESEIKFRIREERKEKRENGRGCQRAESYQEGQEAHTVRRRSWHGERVMAGRGARQKGPGHSVQFSSVASDSLWPHEPQHARPPCPSLTPGVHSNSCRLSQWCLPAISSSVIPFSSCPESLPASESFPIRQLFTRGGRSIGVSALASVLPMNTQDWSLLEWTGVGSPCSPRDSQESSPTPQFKSINSSVLSFLHSKTLMSIHDHWKNHSLD